MAFTPRVGIRIAVFANGQSVQSTIAPRRPSPVDELGKAGLQSCRPYSLPVDMVTARREEVNIEK